MNPSSLRSALSEFSSAHTFNSSHASLAAAQSATHQSATPAFSANSPLPQVLRGKTESPLNAVQWSTPGADRGIIFVGGKNGGSPASAAAQSLADRGIIIVGGKSAGPGAPASPATQSLAQRGIVFVGGKAGAAANAAAFADIQTPAGSNIDAIKNRLQNTLADLESQDKLSNFEIQDLMSSYNQNETLASSVMKKSDDTANAIIGKI